MFGSCNAIKDQNVIIKKKLNSRATQTTLKGLVVDKKVFSFYEKKQIRLE